MSDFKPTEQSMRHGLAATIQHAQEYLRGDFTDTDRFDHDIVIEQLIARVGLCEPWKVGIEIWRPVLLAARMPRVDEQKHASGQRNALGTIIGCECESCEAVITRLRDDNFGHKIQGAR